MAHLLIQGAEPRPPTGSPFPRFEIHDFVKPTNIRQYSLYIQALQALYAKQDVDVASYFQISGIHGLPNTPWNGAPGPGWYCLHNTIIFSQWHRPYVVLFEQEVQRLARHIADTYPVPGRAAWQQAAAELRQPYWGWDSEATYIPPLEVIAYDVVNIITPASNGTLVPVPNPFLAYHFRAGENGTFPAPYNGQATTLRYPKNNETRVGALINGLLARKTQIVEGTRRLHSITNFSDFTFGSASNSGLESIHGSIHVAVGGTGGGSGETAGHMSVVSVAAFDPIFWLHHCQVDRILQGWYSNHGEWPANTDDLIPFWRTQNTFWKAPDVKYPASTFNYRFGSLDFGPPAEAINPATFLEQTRAADEAVIQEWSVRVNCKLFEVGGSFSVYIFLGDVPNDPAKWISDPAYAAVYDVFTNASPEQCPGCSENRDFVIAGSVHLNKPILNRSSDITFGEEKIVPLLKDKLKWAVQRVSDGKAVDVKNFPSLELTVQRTPLKLPAGAEHPHEGKPVYYHDITRGRTGGYNGKYKYGQK